MKKILLTTVAVLFALSAQADLLAVDHEHNWNNSSSSSSGSSSTGNYSAALQAAKAEQKKARKLGYEWNTIGGKKGLLAKAAKLHKKGKTKAAIKLLNVAKTHGMLGQQQARDQANAGPRF